VIREHLNLLRTSFEAVLALTVGLILALGAIAWAPVMIIADAVAWACGHE